MDYVLPNFLEKTIKYFLFIILADWIKYNNSKSQLELIKILYDDLKSRKNRVLQELNKVGLRGRYSSPSILFLCPQ